MIRAVILAAGESRRMGVHKMLLPFGGKTAIAHIADRLLESAVDEVVVVVGHEGGRVAAALAELSARVRAHPCPSLAIVDNPEYRTGMLSSVRAGLRDLPKECAAVLVALGDQPAIGAELVDGMIEKYRKIAPGILVPSFAGRRGHPIIFSANYREEIMVRFDEEGLRGLLRAHADEVYEFEAESEAVLTDMDYPADYRRELERYQQNGL